MPPVARFHNVTISNIEATGATDMACSITGILDHPIENVTLENIRLSFADAVANHRSAAEIPEQIKRYPEGAMFGQLPACGLYVRHVAGLTMRNVQLGWEKPDERRALVCGDVSDLNIDTLRTQVSPSAQAVIVLRNSRDAMVRACRPHKDAAAFLRLEGTASNVFPRRHEDPGELWRSRARLRRQAVGQFRILQMTIRY